MHSLFEVKWRVAARYTALRPKWAQDQMRWCRIWSWIPKSILSTHKSQFAKKRKGACGYSTSEKNNRTWLLDLLQHYNSVSVVRISITRTRRSDGSKINYIVLYCCYAYAAMLLAAEDKWIAQQVVVSSSLLLVQDKLICFYYFVKLFVVFQFPVSNCSVESWWLAWR